jgi:hypothetical protein
MACRLTTCWPLEVSSIGEPGLRGTKSTGLAVAQIGAI